MLFAARIGDDHKCPRANPGSGNPHVGGLITLSPSPPPPPRTVIIEGAPAAVEGDMCICTGPPDSIKKGSGTVTICGKPAARLKDPTEHGGMISTACSKVIIGG
jgi:uncharacterized Zn-binding protein involved in type VI secretion